jgi:hypothetical protein
VTLRAFRGQSFFGLHLLHLGDLRASLFVFRLSKAEEVINHGRHGTHGTKNRHPLLFVYVVCSVVGNTGKDGHEKHEKTQKQNLTIFFL